MRHKIQAIASITFLLALGAVTTAEAQTCARSADQGSHMSDYGWFVYRPFINPQYTINIPLEIENLHPDVTYVQIRCAVFELDKSTSHWQEKTIMDNSFYVHADKIANGDIVEAQIPICLNEGDLGRPDGWRCNLSLSNSGLYDHVAISPDPSAPAYLRAKADTPVVTTVRGNFQISAPATVSFTSSPTSSTETSPDTSSTTIPSATELQEALPRSGPSPTEALTDNATIVGNEVATPAMKALLPTTDEKSIITDFLNSPAIVGPSQ